MSARSLRARLDRLGTPPTEDAPTCRFHSTHCQMGANWPLSRAAVDPASVQMDELLDLMIAGRRRMGGEVPEHPRDVWATDRHERVPDAELQERKREAAELLARMQERNDRIEARIRAGDADADEPWPQ